MFKLLKRIVRRPRTLANGKVRRLRQRNLLCAELQLALLLAPFTAVANVSAEAHPEPASTPVHHVLSSTVPLASGAHSLNLGSHVASLPANQLGHVSSVILDIGAKHESFNLMGSSMLTPAEFVAANQV